MNDTDTDTAAAVADLVAKRHREMTPAERWEAASSMFEAARAIVESSLPAHLTRDERQLAVTRRLYGNELSERTLEAFSACRRASAIA